MTDLNALLAGSGLSHDRDDRITQLPDGSRVVYLHAGQIHASAQPVRITTILGSCVSVCLWDAAAGLGGMNHYMLPDDLVGYTPSPRHANFAIRQLIAQLDLLGANRLRLQAKIFGGASVFAPHPGARHLGAKNVAVARARLQEANIPIVGEDVGASHGRKLTFCTHSGLTAIKKI
jgi:chemotaxis protein CheD